MEAINRYVDSVFQAKEDTPKTQEMKERIRKEMMDRYEQEVSQGKSDKEALGIVIAEYADLEKRVAQEQNEQKSEQPEGVPMSAQQAQDYLSDRSFFGLLNGLGVFLIIFGVAMLILLGDQSRIDLFAGQVNIDSSGMGLVVLLLCVAIAVALFIYSGVRLDKYEAFDEGIALDETVRDEFTQNKEAFDKKHALILIVGVSLCILSPLAIIIPSTIFDGPFGFEPVLLLLMVAIAVFLFVYFGATKDAYERILKRGEYRVTKKQMGRTPRIFSAVIWPVATIIFLIGGFIFGAWHIIWLVFVVAGILNGMVANIYANIKKQ